MTSRLPFYTRGTQQIFAITSPSKEETVVILTFTFSSWLFAQHVCGSSKVPEDPGQQVPRENLTKTFADRAFTQ